MRKFGLLLALLFAAAVPALTATVSPTATVTWTAPSTNTDGSSISGTLSYNIYMAVQGSTLLKVQSGVAGSSATVISGVTPGTTQCITVTAVVATIESAQPTPVCTPIPVPTPTPNAPTQITVTIH